jgi:hypothetical protein
MITREREAGRLYVDGAKAVSSGGHELRSLAMHLILMIKGTVQHSGALWPIRELHDGKVVNLDRFIDYLLRPPRDGLGLPNLYFLKRTLEATPNDGDRALAMVRSELAKEHVDLDEQARRDEKKLHGERPALGEQGGDRRSEAVISDQADNISLNSSGHGTSAAYLAARLRRDFPEIADKLAAGKFKSVRAAAIAAGLITPKNPLEQIQKLWAKLDRAGREAHLDWTLKQCATCGRSGAVNGFWCDACVAENQD